MFCLTNIRSFIHAFNFPAFIDDDGDFDASIDYADNSNASNQQNDSYNNNSYSQDAAEDVEDSDGIDSEEDDTDEDDENSDAKSQKDKDKKAQVPAKIVENVDYIKDEEGKYVCQICNKKLVDKKGLNLHVRLHTGENLKRCNICNRGKKISYSDLTSHCKFNFF